MWEVLQELGVQISVGDFRRMMESASEYQLRICSKLTSELSFEG